MARKSDYIRLKVMIEAGKIERFSDIEDYIAKDALAKPMRITYYTLENRLDNSGMMRIDEFFRLAKVLDIEPSLLIKIFGPGKIGRKKKK